MKLTLALAASLTLAGLSQASAQIVVDHQPYPLGGGGADTEFLFNGQPFWNIAADDFEVGSPAAIKSVAWWGYYRTPAPTDETMRIRLYDARPADGLPGAVLFEQFVADPTRVATGRLIGDQGLPPEYRYQTTLSDPMLLLANTLYWLEISQMGDPASWFVHELSIAERTSRVFKNPATVDWRRNNDTADLAFQLIVPEPATAATLAVGLAALVANRRRRSPVPGPPGRHRASAVDQP